MCTNKVKDDPSPDYYRGIEDSMGGLLEAAKGAQNADKAQLVDMMTTLLCETSTMRAVTFQERFKSALREKRS
jgi:hypothetical protein